MKPWDQQEGEPDAAYSHFLAYRNLGPSRSLRAMATNGNQRQPNRRPQPSGTFARYSAEWNWLERAEAWDVWRMLDIADAVHATMTELTRQLACKGLRSVIDDNKNSGWRAGLEIFNTLANIVQKKPTDAGVGPTQPGGQPKLHISPSERPNGRPA